MVEKAELRLTQFYKQNITYNVICQAYICILCNYWIMKNYLKSIREDRDIKQQELAKILKISTAQYSRLENNLCSMSIDQAIILADYFGVSLDELVGREVKLQVSSSEYNVLLHAAQIIQNMNKKNNR